MDKPVLESVWDYPRPPRVEPFKGLVEIVQGGLVVASSTATLRVLETSHPPTYYIPKSDILMEMFYPTSRKTRCEFKGEASYWGMDFKGKKTDDVAWSYEHPLRVYKSIQGHLSFYAAKMDGCFVNGERVDPQEGTFYGGWVTSWVKGPFKGGPGTQGW